MPPWSIFRLHLSRTRPKQRAIHFPTIVEERQLLVAPWQWLLETKRLRKNMQSCLGIPHKRWQYLLFQKLVQRIPRLRLLVQMATTFCYGLYGVVINSKRGMKALNASLVGRLVLVVFLSDEAVPFVAKNCSPLPSTCHARNARIQ